MSDAIMLTASLPSHLVARLDDECARRQRMQGPARRVSRSALVREILEQHLAPAPAAPVSPAAPACNPLHDRPVRLRRKPATDG